MIDLKASAVSLFVHFFFRTTRRIRFFTDQWLDFFVMVLTQVRSRHLRLFVHPIRSGDYSQTSLPSSRVFRLLARPIDTVELTYCTVPPFAREVDRPAGK